jgi:PAS domain S-box-containing protein
MLEGAGDGAFVIRGDGRIALWNRAAERILGHTARSVVGRRCCDVFAAQDHDGNRLCMPGCHVMNLVRQDEPVRSFDMRVRTRAGKLLWLNVSVIGAPGSNDDGPYTVHLFRDVTADKEIVRLVHDGLQGARPGAAPGTPEASLSRRELEVLQLMVDGLNTAMAAERLHVSRATVRNHVQNIFGKLGVHSRLEAVAYAARHRLL